MPKKKTAAPESLEKQMWKAADKLRKNINAAKHHHDITGHSSSKTELRRNA